MKIAMNLIAGILIILASTILYLGFICQTQFNNSNSMLLLLLATLLLISYIAINKVQK